MKPLTQELLRELFTYEPDTGLLVRHSTNRPTGSPHPRGHLLTTIQSKQYYVHRLIWCWLYGYYPVQIDHEDGNPGNNKLSNLRATNNIGNSQNSAVYNTSKTKISGVVWTPNMQAWQARICVNYEQINLGFTKDFFAACCLRKSAELRYGFHKNHGRQK